MFAGSVAMKQVHGGNYLKGLVWGVAEKMGFTGHGECR